MKKIILLEDEEVLGRLYEKKLKKAGFEVYWAKTSDEVQALIESIKADVIILDHAIRGEDMTGIDMLPIVRKKFPKAKIIILSNFSGNEFEQKARQAGADDYFVKINMPPSTLATHLKQSLKKK